MRESPNLEAQYISNMESQGSFLSLTFFLRNHGRLVVWALVCSVGVSLSQLLLALLLGAYFEVNQAAGSTKGAILQALGIAFEQYRSYFMVLGGLILLRGLFAWGQRYTFSMLENHASDLQKRKGVENFLLHGDIMNPSERARTLARIQRVGPGITKWSTEGVIRPIGDAVFVLFVAFFMARVNALFALVFFGVVLFFGLIVQFVSMRLLKSSSKAWSTRRRAFIAVDRAMHQVRSIRMMNREKPVLRQLHLAIRREWQKKQQTFSIEALHHAIAPVAFFCAVLAVLASDFAFAMEIPAPTFLVFILLSMYLQGAIRRLMKAPHRWAKAKVERVKWNHYMALVTDRQKEEKAPVDHAPALMVASCLNPNAVSIDWPLAVPSNAWSILPMKNRAEVDSFLQALVKLTPECNCTGTLFGHDIAAMTGFQIRRNIAFVGLDFALDGKSLADAVCYSVDAEKERKLIRSMALFDWDVKSMAPSTPIEGVAFGSDDYFRLLVLRALMTKKKLLVLSRFFDEMSKGCALELRSILNNQKNLTILEIQIASK